MLKVIFFSSVAITIFKVVLNLLGITIFLGEVSKETGGLINGLFSYSVTIVIIGLLVYIISITRSQLLSTKKKFAYLAPLIFFFIFFIGTFVVLFTGNGYIKKPFDLIIYHPINFYDYTAYTDAFPF